MAHWSKKQLEDKLARAHRFDTNSDIGEPPPWLGDEAKDVWVETIEGLSNLGAIDMIDRQYIAIYCELIARFLHMQKEIDRCGLVELSKSGFRPTIASTESQKCARLIDVYAKALGITPAGRKSLAKKEKLDEEEESNADLFG